MKWTVYGLFFTPDLKDDQFKGCFTTVKKARNFASYCRGTKPGDDNWKDSDFLDVVSFIRIPHGVWQIRKLVIDKEEY